MISALKSYAIQICALTAFVLGLGLGWRLWSGKTTTIYREVAAQAIRLPGGGEVLEKKVAKKPSIKQELPAGSTVLEEGSVVFQPTEKPGAVKHVHRDVVPDQPATQPKQYTLTFAIIKTGDNERRVVFNSPDGSIIGGVDVVIDPPKQTKPLLNALGLIGGKSDNGDRALGAFYDRDWKFTRTGVEVTNNTYANVNKKGWEIRAKFGVRF